jgi:small subunit ribosomal protein S13
MPTIPPVRPKSYREKVFFKKLRSQVDGNALVEQGLIQIKGVGRQFAKAVVKIADVDPETRIGALTEKNLNEVEEIILDPLSHGIPPWMVNLKKDSSSGENLHLVGNRLDLQVKRDIDRMKRNRSFKGLYHKLKVRVRGKRNRR